MVDKCCGSWRENFPVVTESVVLLNVHLCLAVDQGCARFISRESNLTRL